MRTRLVITLALVLGFATAVLADNVNWNRFRQDVRSCDQDDAHCVGLTIINMMEQLHEQGGPVGGETKCSCNDGGMSCFVRSPRMGIIRIEGSVPFTFSSNCEEQVPFAESKGAFCDDGKDGNKTVMWTINARQRKFDRFAEYTFSSDCEEALEEMK